MNIENQFIGLMMIAVLVALAARRLRIPYTIAMVLTGLAVSLLHPASLTGVQLEPHLILSIFLPGLLFEAAYHLDLDMLRANIKTILLLAIPGVLLSMFIIGFVLKWALDFPLTEALLFGVLISATDPIAVVGLFKDLGVSRRLGIIVEGESLLNDGIAIVVYSILVGVVTGEQTFSLAGAIGNFFVTVGGGILLGLLIGFVVGEFMKRTEDTLIDIALTTILAYGTYIIAAEVLHETVSPVIAVVTAAIYVGNFASQGDYSASTHLTIISFWEFIAFLINSAIFLLIGAAVQPATLYADLKPVAIAIGAILLARAVVIYMLGFVANRFVRPISIKWAHVLFWGGLRGAVSIALVLSLPFSLESRLLLKTMAFGYVIFSLLAQGLTIRPLVNWLGITQVSERRREYERHRARVVISQSAIKSIEALRDDNILTGPVCERLCAFYTEQADTHWAELHNLVKEESSLAQGDVRFVERQIAQEQRRDLLVLVRRGLLSQDVYEEFSREIQEELSRTFEDDWKPPDIVRLKNAAGDPLHGLPSSSDGGAGGG